MKKIISTNKLDETIQKLSNTVNSLRDAYVCAPITAWNLGDTIKSALTMAENQLTELTQFKDLLYKIPAELGLVEDFLEEEELEEDDIDWEEIDEWLNDRDYDEEEEA